MLLDTGVEVNGSRNALAYYDTATVTAVKRFIVQAEGWWIILMFCEVRVLEEETQKIWPTKIYFGQILFFTSL